ncbi:MAG: hypothetical protein ACRDX8_05000, partial [Acidimicrobiales bacterium]
MYTYPGGTSASTSSCPQSATLASECSLTQALADATSSGDTIYLEADSTGATSDTTSGWSTGASGLTITSAPGVAAILDGQGVSQYVLKYTGPGTGTNGLAVRDLTIEGSATNFGNGGGILNGNG